MTASNITRTLHDGWTVYKTAASEIESPNDYDFSGHQGLEVSIPSSLFSHAPSVPEANGHLEDFDWWYRCDFSLSDIEDARGWLLQCESLASIADIWLNGEYLACSQNMFLPVNVDVSHLIGANNHLDICFRSVNHFLKQRRPRPGWKTNLVNHQQLRWLRTSLLGRIPGWTPATPALGPCGPITLQQVQPHQVNACRIHTSLTDGRGEVNISVELPEAASSVSLKFGEHETDLHRTESDSATDKAVYTGQLVIDDPALWWPNTHGEQNLYPCRLDITSPSGTSTHDAGVRGFRQLQWQDDDKGLQLSINGTPVYLRGACWTIQDPTTFYADEARLRKLLQLARDAGINMLRVGGTMHYESETFHHLCDELGILVWQDFMFANMDYPVEDDAFNEAIQLEARYQLSRLSQHVSTTIFCGNSEIQQQAAMMGVERERWSNAFFDETLSALCSHFLPEAPYFPSTPCGGVLPFHLAEGITHFYGVGAYKKSLLESGLDRVRFTAECLGFSNVPEPRMVEKLFNGANPVCHSPIWKQGVPRDSSAGWDFEDIRDHYIATLYRQDPVTLRSQDSLRYLAVSRVVIAELIKQVIGHWRNPATPCGGSLLWFYKDLVPGAGWGMLDSDGTPKSVYYYLKQAFSSRAAFLLDRGLDGLQVQLHNDSAEEQHWRLELKLLNCPDVVVESYEDDVRVPARDCWQENLEALLGHFRDPTYSYQFGASQYQLVALQVFDVATNELVSQDVYYPDGMQLPNEATAEIQVELQQENDQDYLLIQSDRFLQASHLELSKFIPCDNYFHLLPGVPRRVAITAESAGENTVKGYLSALNLPTPVRIRVKREAP